MNLELPYVDFDKVRKDKARILIAQPAWNPEQMERDSYQCWQLSFTELNEKFIDAILAKGNEKKVDLIVFPEFSIPEKYLEKIQKWSASNDDVVVVAGSTYLKREDNLYNTASVFFKGEHYKTEKKKLSPIETSDILGNYGPKPGTQFNYFQNTPVGKLGVLICSDEFDRDIRNDFLSLELDLLCVIAMQPKGIDHHQSINEIVKEANKGIYVVYCNALCGKYSDGKSAFFAYNYDNSWKEYKDAGLTRDDEIKTRQIEMPTSDGCLVLECNLVEKKATFHNLDPDRSLVNPEPPFIFENYNLRQLSLEEVKAPITKPSKTKAEYQASIPPVKPFVSDYIGRKTDIDYLNEFLNNQNKHLLLLYGVGGMGKSHLLYCCMKDYRGKTFFCHAVSPNEEFTLNKLYEICLVPKPDDKLSLEEKQNHFVTKFQENNTYLILEDYYEIQLEEVKSILPKLINIGRGKLLIISRVIPLKVIHFTSDFRSHQVLPLLEPDFKQVINNYIEGKNIILTDEEIHLIFEKAQGYPLGGQLIINAKPICVNLNELLSDLPKFEAKIDPEGKYYSGRILGWIFQRGNEKEQKLLCEFSALFGSSDIETIRILPSYEDTLFQGLYKSKSFVDMDTQGKFSSHAMIRDFAYYRLQNKEALHLKLAKYFESKINGRTDNDWKWLNEATLHYSKTRQNELDSFTKRVERNFESRNIKGQIDSDVIKTIRNYTSLINLYPDRLAYYNELGIAYRQNRQNKNTIETFLRALEIEPNNVKVLNELGITYRENNQKTKAIETFLRALEIDAKHLPSLNELGITYRENNQKTKAIETFVRALEIEPNNVKVLNELGITYRENNQKTKAIETFLRALEIDAKHLPSLNELGITYRENNQKTKAIETFLRALEIDAKHLPSLNELGITYRENNQKTKAIETFLRALEIDAKHLPSLNELGITYRENNQKTKAIETFLRALEIDAKHLPSLNELGITYRENNQKTKSIEILKRAIDFGNFQSVSQLSITYRENNQIDDAINLLENIYSDSGNKYINLALWQIYLFFKPDKNKAMLNFDILMKEPKLSEVENNQFYYKSFIKDLDSIWGTTNSEYKIYDRYFYWSIVLYKAHHQILPLLKRSENIFSDKSMLKSRLGRTLCNEVIGEYLSGWDYLKQAIALFKKENNKHQLQHHLIFYFNILLNQHQAKLIENEMKNYENDLIHNADYFVFMAHYSFAKNKNIGEAISFFKKAIEISDGINDKREFAESLLIFLSEQNIKLYKHYFLKYEAIL